MSRKTLVLALAFITLAASAWAAGPDALWNIIQSGCVPCVERADDHVILRDRRGAAQFLIMPTTRIAGIETPSLLEATTPNYFAIAWANRLRVEQTLSRHLNRDQLVLTINSAHGRSQNHLHIHLDCLDAKIGKSLAGQTITNQWQPIPGGLKGHPYLAKRLDGTDLTANPIQMVAAEIPGAREHMDNQTIAVVGVEPSGFILLADHADPSTDNPGHAEELQDWECK